MKNLFVICMITLVVLLLGSLVISCQQSELTPTVEEIIQAVKEATDEIDTYQYDIDLVMIGTDGEYKNTFELKVSSNRDNKNRKMYMKLESYAEEESFNSSSEYVIEVYVADDWRYYMSSFDDTWNKIELSERYWEEWGIMKRQLLLLTVLPSVVRGDNDTIDGVECYKLQLKPDLDTLWECIQKEDMIFFDQFLEGLDYSQNIVDEYTISLWVTKDTNYLVKTTEDYILTDNVNTVTYNETVLINHINEPVSIELPSDIEEIGK
ncbi:MAG: hypothetical protein JSV32_01455 [Dehalococcoidia bacterium]|nr:MAG: hypothetical protein JSV32_01455 [Dehalococcoidia bacterium]